MEGAGAFGGSGGGGLLGRGGTAKLKLAATFAGAAGAVEGLGTGLRVRDLGAATSAAESPRSRFTAPPGMSHQSIPDWLGQGTAITPEP